MDEVPDFERFPMGHGEVLAEQVEKAKEWGDAMKDASEFSGDQFGIAHEGNEFYGEAKSGEGENAKGEQFDSGIANASALINYGVDEAARKMGVETVVQMIKGFDASGREDPIGDLFKYLGINTPEEYNELQQEGEASKMAEAEFREGVNAPSTGKSVEGVFRALDDMKKLILEVEGADPRYEELREGAKASGKGYFEYAVSSFGTPGLIELFGVLSSQREKAEDGKNDVSEDLEGSKGKEAIDSGKDYIKEEGGGGEEGKKNGEITTNLGENNRGPEVLSPEMMSGEISSEETPEERARKELEERLKAQEQLNPEILGKQ